MAILVVPISTAIPTGIAPDGRKETTRYFLVPVPCKTACPFQLFFRNCSGREVNAGLSNSAFGNSASDKPERNRVIIRRQIIQVGRLQSERYQFPFDGHRELIALPLQLRALRRGQRL